MSKRNDILPLDVVDFMEAANYDHQDRQTVFLHGENPAIRELALWDEILECENANKSLPEWTRQALIQYAKKKYARIKHREQHQIVDDYRAFELVRFYLTKHHKPKSAKTARSFSMRRACEHAAKELYPNIKELTPERIQNVRRAYERAFQRNKKGFYVSPLFMEMLSERKG